MKVELTKDAQKAAAIIYKSYLNKVKDGMSKTEARKFSDNELCGLLKKYQLDDISLIESELITVFSMKTDILDNVTLSTSFIIFMENRFKNGLTEVISFLSQFIP